MMSSVTASTLGFTLRTNYFRESHPPVWPLGGAESKICCVNVLEHIELHMYVKFDSKILTSSTNSKFYQNHVPSLTIYDWSQAWQQDRPRMRKSKKNWNLTQFSYSGDNTLLKQMCVFSPTQRGTDFYNLVQRARWHSDRQWIFRTLNLARGTQSLR